MPDQTTTSAQNAAIMSYLTSVTTSEQIPGSMPDLTTTATCLQNSTLSDQPSASISAQNAATLNVQNKRSTSDQSSAIKSHHDQSNTYVLNKYCLMSPEECLSPHFWNVCNIFKILRSVFILAFL